MTTPASISSDIHSLCNEDRVFLQYSKRQQARVKLLLSDGKTKLFVTSVDRDVLWEKYLDSFASEHERQGHDCHCCRNFIKQFGGLVTISELGVATSVLWDEEDTPALYQNAARVMKKEVEKHAVSNVFVSSIDVLGTPVTGPWNHFTITLPKSMLHVSKIAAANAVVGEKKEDFRNVSRALNEYSKETVETALIILRSDSLYRSEKVLGVCEWFYDLQLVYNSVNNRNHNSNLVWKAIASAPPGFAHIRSSMIGTLLDDIQSGKDFDSVKRSFAAKMHPTIYQRPQAAPTAGAVANAEKIVEQMGITKSLRRRYMRLDELITIWRPKTESTGTSTGVSNGIFSHLKTKGDKSSPEIKVVLQDNITFEKFRREVLPNAEKMLLFAPSHGNYTAFVTAVDPDAPPILQWDNNEQRNPASAYVWTNGSSASQWGLEGNTWVEVEAVALKPSMWYVNYDHHGQSSTFVLAGARESRNPGLALFPESLKSELHGVRSVIEAYSNSSEMEGMNQPHVAGLVVGNKKTITKLSVRIKNVWIGYSIDRWD